MSERQGGRPAPAEQLLEEWLAHRAAATVTEDEPSDPTRDVLVAIGVEPPAREPGGGGA